MTELVEQGKFHVHEWGIAVVGKPTFAEWSAVTCYVIRVHRRTLWLIGDLLNIGEECFGDDYAQIFADIKDKLFDYDRQTLYNAKYVAKHVPLANRALAPSFSHAAEVASLPPDEQEKWLRRAADEGWTKQDLRNELAKKYSRQGGATYTAICTIQIDGERIILTPDPTSVRGKLPAGIVKVIISPA